MKELDRFKQFLNEGVEDINIMGQKFNFHDVCPTAHKTVSDLAKKFEGDKDKSSELLTLAQAHQDFFTLEKKALATKKLSDDEINDVKRLYTEITNMAFFNRAFGEEVGNDIAKYMNMHMDTIKQAIGDFFGE